MGQLQRSAIVSHHTLPWDCCKGSRLWLQAESEQALEGCALLHVHFGCVGLHERQEDCRVRLMQFIGPALQSPAASAGYFWAKCQAAGGAHAVPMLPPVLASKRGL